MAEHQSAQQHQAGRGAGDALRRGLTMAEALAMGVEVFLLSVLICARFTTRTCFGVQQGPCASNLRDVGVACSLYISDHGGWPDHPTNGRRLAALRKGYISTSETFECPATRRRAVYDGARGELRRYGYWLDAPIAPDADPLRAAAGDYNARGMNHSGGSVLLFADGHTRWITIDAAGRHPSPYLSFDADTYRVDTAPRKRDDADLD